MKKITFMVIGILLVIGLVGAGTFAYFSDTETRTGNVMQAGTIDLELSVDEIALGTFSFTNILPGEDLGPMEIKLANICQNNGYLYQKITYAEGDLGTPVENLTADEFAALIYVKSIIYQHVYADESLGSERDDLLSMMVMDFNGDGFVSLYEMKDILMPYSDIYPEDPSNLEHTLKAGEAATYTITFRMAEAFEQSEGVAYTGAMEDYDGNFSLYIDPVVWNAPQADGIVITWEAILNQNPTPGYGEE